MRMTAKMTLDTQNAIIALENEQTSAHAIRELIARHRRGQIAVSLCGVAASENTRSGASETWYHSFEQRLSRLDLLQIPILLPVTRLGFSYWGRCVLASEEMKVLEWEIHQILHPRIQYNYRAFCDVKDLDASKRVVDPEWRNAICDSQALCCHIHYGNDVFVSDDRNYRKTRKMEDLLELGAGLILTPDEAIQKLDAGEPFLIPSDAYRRLKISRDPSKRYIPTEFKRYRSWVESQPPITDRST